MANNNKGQALIETVIGIPLIAALFYSFIYLLYFSTVYFLIQFKTQESLFCINHRPSNECKLELVEFLKKILLFNENFSINSWNQHSLGKSRTKTRQARISIQMAYHSLEISADAAQ